MFSGTVRKPRATVAAGTLGRMHVNARIRGARLRRMFLVLPAAIRLKLVALGRRRGWAQKKRPEHYQPPYCGCQRQRLRADQSFPKRHGQTYSVIPPQLISRPIPAGITAKKAGCRSCPPLRKVICEVLRPSSPADGGIHRSPTQSEPPQTGPSSLLHPGPEDCSGSGRSGIDKLVLVDAAGDIIACARAGIAAVSRRDCNQKYSHCRPRDRDS